MTHQQAIRILMLSPVYFRLAPWQRMQLIKEYCRQFAELTSAGNSGKKAKS